MTNVIVAGARTPIGRLGGALASFEAPELGAIAIAEALQRAGIEPGEVDSVLMGQVVQAGVGPNPARKAAVEAGIPMSVPAATLNKLCLSGLAAISWADQAVASGRHRIVIAGGMESMTRAPYVTGTQADSRRTVEGRARDALEVDALICGFDGIHVGAATERYQRAFGMTREEQDAYAVRSHARAAAAIADGRLDAELVRVPGTELVADEGVRPGITLEKLALLQPAFADDGTITAGSASQISDGACAVVVMSREDAEARGLEWLAEIGGAGAVAGPDPSLLSQPAAATREALARDQRYRRELELEDISVFEINEAFAGVALRSQHELGADAELVNVNGGAIAVGHPVGMSGARLALTLGHELKRRGGGHGVAALCGGGGQGEALILSVPA